MFIFFLLLFFIALGFLFKSINDSHNTANRAEQKKYNKRITIASVASIILALSTIGISNSEKDNDNTEESTTEETTTEKVTTEKATTEEKTTTEEKVTTEKPTTEEKVTTEEDSTEEVTTEEAVDPLESKVKKLTKQNVSDAKFSKMIYNSDSLGSDFILDVKTTCIVT